MYKILIVDDEQRIREVICEYAVFEGHQVVEASDGMEAVLICKEQDFDLIIMDVMMPKLDGFSACKEIRKAKDIPVLMLSARGEEYDKLFGFEMGVDDYVVKPFSPKELMARVNAIVNRHKSAKSQEQTPKANIRFGGLCIDQLGRSVYVNDSKIELTPKEYDLLLHLASNNNVALSREQLLNAVWGFDFYGDDRTVDSHIKMLRASLGSCRDLIVTLRGVGYKFEG